MSKYSTVIIGGGAAGVCAAISTARRGEYAIICEKLPLLGKKLLATGNGRCNLLNDELSETYYNPSSRNLVRSVFDRFGKSEIAGFFNALGLQIYSKDGRVFPVTNQASSVLKVLEMELARLGVRAEFGFDCCGISCSPEEIRVSSRSGKRIVCRKVVITGGGQTYPALGSDGSAYLIAAQLGHTIVKPVPAAVPLLIKDNLCFVLQGQRIAASVRSIIDGRQTGEAAGDLLFTKYGLSGTAILDISEEISAAVNRLRRAEVFVSVDLVPFMEEDQLKTELEQRINRKTAPSEILVGILPNKVSSALKGLFEQNNVDSWVRALKDRRFKVAGTRGWNEAEFTCGGVATNEVMPGTLESRLQKGVYFAGEVLDVNGKRGGYNLAWAWASGFVAGLS